MKLFIFGSTGDLVRRKVMKSLQELKKPGLEIFAVGRRELNTEEYLRFIGSDWCTPEFKKTIQYLKVDFKSLNPQDLENKMDNRKMNFFYISLPPALHKKIAEFMGKLSEKYKISILFEKPFGRNLENAIELKKLLNKPGLAGNIAISDHYLFKKSFMNIKQEKKNFKTVKIVSLEKLGLEERKGYYDSAGALKDMIQSHFLNLLLKNLNFRLSPDKIKVQKFLRGQYAGYEEELGEKSNTETFVYLKFTEEGKAFEFITGKSMNKKESFIEIDGEKFTDKQENSYVELFKRFLALNLEGFPKIQDAVFGWQIIQVFEKEKPELFHYKKGSELSDILNSQKNL